MTSHWIVENVEKIEKNSFNDTIGDILQLFLTEKITNNELFEFGNYSLTYIYNLSKATQFTEMIQPNSDLIIFFVIGEK